MTPEQRKEVKRRLRGLGKSIPQKVTDYELTVMAFEAGVAK